MNNIIMLLVLLPMSFSATFNYTSIEAKTINLDSNNVLSMVFYSTYSTTMEDLFKVEEEIPHTTKMIEEEVVEEVQIIPMAKMLDVGEWELLIRLVEAEATGLSLESKANVAKVILNRLNSPLFPNTVEEVIKQKDQFSPISDGRIFKVEVTEETKEAVIIGFSEEYSTIGEAVFFCNYQVISNRNKRWFNTLEKTYVDKEVSQGKSGHTFFK